MYLFPLELYPIEGFADKVTSTLETQGCINPNPATPDTGKPVSAPSGSSGGGDSGGSVPSSGTVDSSGGTVTLPNGDTVPAPPPPDKCAKAFFDGVGQTFLDLIEVIRGKLNELLEIIRQFDPIPKGWTFREEIEDALGILDTITQQYNGMKQTFSADRYKEIVASLTQLDALTGTLKKDINKAIDELKKVLPNISASANQFGDDIKNIAEGVGSDIRRGGENVVTNITNFGLGIGSGAENAYLEIERDIRKGIQELEKGLGVLGEIKNALSIFKTPRGTINVDIVAEYDRLYDSTGIEAQKQFMKKQREQAANELLKTTGQFASGIQSLQNPDFFKSILDSIIYGDATTNPNFVYLNKPYENKTLEQARQIIFYVIYAMVTAAVLYFLSTKTILVPFFYTFVFWFKRYFVFLAWLFVVAMIYSFMTDWFWSLIREDVKFISYTVNPVLHPGVYEIWHSKYKQWIKHIVYGLSTLGFFIVALFLTAVILFLIMPLLLLLLWASGQLMSYFEKEELDE
jgi:hypothetical protein